jgi:hypothetical protein
MRRLSVTAAVTAMVLLALGATARATVIPIPNGDFMTPDASAYPYAVPDMGSWQKAPAPAWWTGSNYTTDQWYQTSGVFYNQAGLVPDTHITNLTSQQAAFLFANKDNELYQELTATYSAGQSYHLNFGLIPSNDSVPYVGAIQQGTPIDIVLYYRDGTNRMPVASMAVVNTTELMANHTLMSNFTLETTVVQAGDAWAGKAIGIQFLSGADFTNMGGVWDIGNVQLTATPVPEAGALGVLACGMIALGWRRKRVA